MLNLRRNSTRVFLALTFILVTATLFQLTLDERHRLHAKQLRRQLRLERFQEEIRLKEEGTTVTAEPPDVPEDSAFIQFEIAHEEELRLEMERKMLGKR